MLHQINLFCEDWDFCLGIVIRNGEKLSVSYGYGLGELSQSPTPCDTDSRKRSLLLHQTKFIFALVINQLLHDSLV